MHRDSIIARSFNFCRPSLLGFGGRLMMQDMMDMMGGMSWGMGLVSLLVLIILILGIAALVKYLFSSR